MSKHTLTCSLVMREEEVPTVDGLTYLTCEFCQFWRDGEGPCTKGFKPREYDIIGGKNPTMHFRRGCMTKAMRPKHWEKAWDMVDEVTGGDFANSNRYA